MVESNRQTNGRRWLVDALEVHSSVDFESSSDDRFFSDEIGRPIVASAVDAELEEAEDCTETPRGAHIPDLNRIFRRERGICRHALVYPND